MRTLKLTFALIISLLSFQIFAASPNLPTPATVVQNLDGIAAVVNNGVITQSELNAAISKAKKQMTPAQAAHVSDSQLRDMLLQQLINEKLQLQLAKHAKLSVTKKQINQAVAHVAQANHLSVAQLKAQLKSHGISFSEYESALKKQILMHQVQMSAVSGKINVTAADIQDFIQKYKAQMAHAVQYKVEDSLIPVDSDNTADIQKAKQQALSLAAQWKKGHKPASAQTTDLGWQTVDTLPALFLDHLKNMKPGDISRPIKAPNGFHVIKLIGIKNNKAKMPSQEQIKNMVSDIKFQKAVKDWLKELRKTSYIHVN